MGDVRHQAPAQLILQKALAGERTAHAYLFHGPAGVGKELLARRFAAVLLCDAPAVPSEVPPEYAHLATSWRSGCGTCRSCRLMASGSHPDYHIIHRQLAHFHESAAVRGRKAQELSIDVIRQFVIEAAGRKAALGDRKVFVVRECERLTAGAQNALLKTLEEPPPGTYLMLLCTAEHRLLPTTRSRCQSVPLGLLPAEFVAERLAALHPDLGDPQIRFLSRHEPGSLGRAQELIDDHFAACNESLIEHIAGLRRSAALELAEHLESLGKQQADRIKNRATEAAGDRAAAAELAEGEAQRQALATVLSMMATIYRDVLILHLGADDLMCNAAARPALEPLARRLTAHAAGTAIRALAATEHQLSHNALARLSLDRLAIELARLHGV